MNKKPGHSSRVLITGGNGLIGRQLRATLEERGYEVSILSRNKGNAAPMESPVWDVERGEIDREAVNSCDYIIHLAGTSIGAGRWTGSRKKEILSSRVSSAELILKNLDKKNRRLKAFVSASAIGYYGALTTDHIYSESDPPAGDFLGQVCREWERAADAFGRIGIRTVKIRTGIVLTRKGGALSRLRLPVVMGVGAPLGHGNQYMPWIHISDLCEIYIRALEQEDMQGAYNAVAPEHVTNRAFTGKIARALKKPYWFPGIPAFVMSLLFGEMSVLLLEGSRVSGEKLQQVGFSFRFPDLDAALEDLYSEI